MTRAMLKLLTATSAAVLISGATIAAHHSFAAFSMQGEKTISGTVKQFDWTNPHTWIWVNVPNEQGVVETWAIEGMSPNFLGRRGWTKSTLKAGDKISVVIRPMRDGSKGGMFVRATLAEGKVLLQTGEPTEP
ncbi:MAG TPA: DUF6152 family protein [Vicinamibacterales bacterium]|nr:DUF6152 family protein [Vicinamibacterales bacterium]